jgi:hypothetical protein
MKIGQKLLDKTGAERLMKRRMLEGKELSSLALTRG